MPKTPHDYLAQASRTAWAAACRAEAAGTASRALARCEEWARRRLESSLVPIPPGAVLHQDCSDATPFWAIKCLVLGRWVDADSPEASSPHRSAMTRTEGRGRKRRRLVWISEHDEFEPVEHLRGFPVPEHCMPVSDADLFHRAHQSGKTPRQALRFGNHAYGASRANAAAAGMPAEEWDLRQARDLLDHQAARRQPPDPDSWWYRDAMRREADMWECEEERARSLPRRDFDDDADLTREDLSPPDGAEFGVETERALACWRMAA